MNALKDFFNGIGESDMYYNLSSGETQLDVKTLLTIVLSAAALGFLISLVYMLTHKKEGYSQSYVVSLILLAPIVSLVILITSNNVGAAFSLAGAFALIRFRSAPGDTKDIAFVFLSVTMGLVCGMNFIIYAVIAAAIICVIILVLYFTKYASKRGDFYDLKITVPETLNYVGAFDEVLDKYTTFSKMKRVKSVDFGALFEITFSVQLKDDKQMREFLDDLRALNGNLKIMLSTQESVKSYHFQ